MRGKASKTEKTVSECKGPEASSRDKMKTSVAGVEPSGNWSEIAIRFCISV